MIRYSQPHPTSGNRCPLPSTFGVQPHGSSPIRQLSEVAKLLVFLLVGAVSAVASAQQEEESEQTSWKLEETQTGIIEVRKDGKVKTQIHFQDFARPILYPIFNGRGEKVTRSWPIVEDVPGEANDHPHHKSLWFGHGDVNGASFWDERARIECREAKVLSDQNAVVLENVWLENGKPLASDQTRIEFGSATDLPAWWIDYHVVVKADQQKLVFGDTKEGTFAIRTHPNLRLNNDPRRNVTTAQGHALNQPGDQDGDLWGKRSPWVAYWGPIGDATTTLVMMDHPTNLRHPTTWHAREYGLVAANPFGLSFFQKTEKGAGQYVLAKDQELSMRYRVLIADRKLEPQEIEAAFQSFRQ